MYDADASVHAIITAGTATQNFAVQVPPGSRGDPGNTDGVAVSHQLYSRGVDIWAAWRFLVF